MGFVEDSKNYGGLDNLLNTWGYFVDYNSDLKQRPHSSTPRLFLSANASG